VVVGVPPEAASRSSAIFQSSLCRLATASAGFQGEDLAETFERLRPWVRHTHWKDSIAPVERPRSDDEQLAESRASQLMSGHRPANYVLFGGGEFPALECLRLLRSAGYAGWFSLEWERAWHPELEPPEIALPLFPRKLCGLWEACGPG
jgi:sugar phosphate isomerase/epimerase